MSRKRELYRIYKQFIKDHEKNLETNFRLRRDYTNFLYTVVNLNPDTVNKYYAEGDRMSKPAINEFITAVDKYFAKYNMSELIAIRKVSRIDDFNWKIEFGFSLFNTKKRANILVYTGLSILLLTILSLFIF